MFETIVYGGFSLFLKLLLKLFWRFKVYGIKNIPRYGPLIIASTHTSVADPPLLAASINRGLCFMAKEELFRIPIFGWLIKMLGAFPVRRGGIDFGAIRFARNLLARKKFLVIFPQGRRCKDFSDLKRGVDFLSRISGVPVVPAVILNSEKMKCFKKVEVHFSSPIKSQTINEELLMAYNRIIYGAHSK